MKEGLDVVSLVAGATLVALGALLLAEVEGAVELEAWLISALVGATGLIFLVSGLDARNR